MKKTSLLSSLVVLSAVLTLPLSTPLHASLLPVTDNGVDWQINYNPDVQTDLDHYDKLPNDNNGTALGATGRYFGGPGGTGTATIVDHYLRTITSTAPENNHKLEYNTAHGYNVTASAITLETRLRVVDMTGTLYAGGFVLGAGKSVDSTDGLYAAIPFSTTAMGAITGLDLTQWTTIRFTIENPSTTVPILSIYINNNPEASYSGAITNTTTADSTYNRIRFGKYYTAGSTEMNGTVEWDYIRWTSEGAFAPIPEPSVALLPFGITVLGVYSLLQRRRAH